MAEPNPVPGRTIGEHGIIGNMETAALVAVDATIDYLCWPRLDSPTVFAGLLDPDIGGEFAIIPELDGVRTLQDYLPETNILVTRWLADEGSAEVTDLMPHPEAEGLPVRALVRRVRVTRGRVRFRLRCRPRPDYARATIDARTMAGGVAFSGGGLSLRLSSAVPLAARDGAVVADFELVRGEEANFVLHEQDCASPDEATIRGAIDGTITAWRRWSGKSTYRGRWREMVGRSALALKLLTSHRHGSIAAAATFGLPEATGAGRNWDYRATWVRDASFSVYALMRLGYTEEAEACRDWFEARANETAGAGRLNVMYAIDGGEAADEVSLDHLAGYGGARPVRIGNAAHSQEQLDIYGELLDSVYLANKYGRAISHEGWTQISEVVERVRRHWRERDAGIWEFRDRDRELLHSRLMCWVAIDRAIRLAQKRSLSAPLVRWSRDRDRIAADIWAHFRHPEHGWFVQERGGGELDASALMMPLVRFVSATDPVWLKTLDAIGERLCDDGLVFRYRNADGLAGGEAAFTTCTFWYAECLARAGRMDEARIVMERGMRLANPLGLFSEEATLTGEPLGNFPQALTHLAFISAAFFLDRRLTDGGGTWQP